MSGIPFSLPPHHIITPSHPHMEWKASGFIKLQIAKLVVLHPTSLYRVNAKHQSHPPFPPPNMQIAGKQPIPPYGQRRKGFVPRAVGDFGDGGAFPEVHIIQYPLKMGKKEAEAAPASSQAIVSVDVSADGEVNFDAIVKQGTNRNKIVFSKLSDMKGGDVNQDVLSKPTPEEEAAQAAKTKNALELLIGGKIAAARPVQLAKNPGADEPTYVRYTPNPNAPGFNSNAKQRVIELVEAQVDPMEPARHKHKKVPRGPPDDPVPVLHSPPRKVSVEDQEAWKIPPCISNWKNAKGYTIPLDKRLAADGRGLQETTINPKFAALPQALYIAEDKAREQIAARAKIDQKIKKLEREQKEQELRELAARSRMARAGINVAAGEGGDGGQRREREESYYGRGAAGGGGGGRGGLAERLVGEERGGDEEEREERRGPSERGGEGEGGGLHTSEEERMAAVQRDKLRLERRKELERDMRKDNMRGAMRKGKMDRDGERDISEKIALGMHVGNAKLTGDEVYDSRLFNQGGGVEAGFGGEDEYNVYSRALFDKGAGGNIYRPRGDLGVGGLDEDGGQEADAQYRKIANSDKFKPDRGFAGADYQSGGQGRDKPVQFEKDGGREGGKIGEGKEDEEEGDFFGVGEFVEKGGKRKDPLGHIGGGGRGIMSASSAGSKEELEEEGGGKRQKIVFTEARNGRRRD